MTIKLIVLIFTITLLIIFQCTVPVHSQMHESVLRFTYGDNDDMGPLNWKKTKAATSPSNTVTSKSVPKSFGRSFGRSFGKSFGRSFGRNLGRSFGRSFGRNLGATAPPVASDPDIGMYKRNRCPQNWLSPINIKSKRVNAPDLGKVTSDIAAEARRRGEEELSETLLISISSKEIETHAWEFGHPPDKYHGIEIRPVNFGMIQLMDNFDPPDKSDPYDAFDFHFLTVFYCDVKKPSHSKRSMHQIDGKRFPLELQFVFLRSTKDRISRNGNPVAVPAVNTLAAAGNPETKAEEESEELMEPQTMAVIVSVIGEIQSQDNKYLKPVIDAAQKFRGKKFGDYSIDDTNVVKIESPWSPTWLLPDNSDYYYYDDGSFCVPPCWKIARYYILREKIGLSQSQLNVLTNIQTAREKESNNIMSCTFSLIQHEILSGEVTVNLIEYELKGEDNKPRSAHEVKEREARIQKMAEFRQRLRGSVISLDSMKENGALRHHPKLKDFLFYTFLRVILLIIKHKQSCHLYY